MLPSFPQLAPGLSAGCALGGAWLTSLGYFRSDRRIRVEETSYVDGGSTRIYLYLEAARLGRLGVMFTALAIILPALTPAPTLPLSLVQTAIVAALTALAITLLGWLRSWVYRRHEHPPEQQVAENIIRKYSEPES